MVTFSSGRKSPGCRAERLHTGECRGAKPLASRRKLLGGGGAQRPPHWGAQRGSPRIKTKTILDSLRRSAVYWKKENRRNHHVRKKTGPQRSLLVRQPEKYKHCHMDFDEKIDHFAARGHTVPKRAMIKTPEQIEGIRQSSKINIAVLDLVAQKITPA